MKNNQSEVSLGTVDDIDIKVDLNTPANSEQKEKGQNTITPVEKVQVLRSTPSPILIEGKSSETSPNMQISISGQENNFSEEVMSPPYFGGDSDPSDDNKRESFGPQRHSELNADFKNPPVAQLEMQKNSSLRISKEDNEMFKKKHPKAETEADRTENSDTYTLVEKDQKNKEQLQLAQSMRIDSTNTSK